MMGQPDRKTAGFWKEKAPPDQRAGRGLWGCSRQTRRALDPVILLPLGGEAQAGQAQHPEDERRWLRHGDGLQGVDILAAEQGGDVIGSTSANYGLGHRVIGFLRTEIIARGSSSRVPKFTEIACVGPLLEEELTQREPDQKSGGRSCQMSDLRPNFRRLAYNA